MTTWNGLAAAAPELAAAVEKIFAREKHAVLATLRSDGRPRVSGIEPSFALGELWVGSMPGALKSADLKRDPRFALHSASFAERMHEGDAKISGRAVVASLEEARAVVAQQGAQQEPGSFDLFRVEVEEVSTVTVEDDKLVIVSWRPGAPVRRVERD